MICLKVPLSLSCRSTTNGAPKSVIQGESTRYSAYLNRRPEKAVCCAYYSVRFYEEEISLFKAVDYQQCAVVNAVHLHMPLAPVSLNKSRVEGVML